MKDFFIRKNTNSILNRLKDMGFILCPCCNYINSICLEVHSKEKIVHGIDFIELKLDGIDCGEDEDYFFEIAKKVLCQK